MTVSYDKNGNLLTDNLNTYTWDSNWGNPASINGTNLIYDANGRMVEQQNGSIYTQMLYGPAGKTAIMNGQTLVKAFVNLPGGETAIYNSSGLAYYRHADWLGSSRLTSTASRGVYSSSAYAPFGEQYAPSGTSDASYTGQNADTASSLYDFTFREHSPSQGRWISPDPSGLASVDPTTPQSWNRYGYVVNNPLAFVDLLGLAWVQACVDTGVLTCAWFWDDTDAGGGNPFPSGPGTAGVSGSGAGGGAANNGPTISAAPHLPWYKNPCVTKAIAKGALSTGIDAIGLIPGGGAVSEGLSLFHGAAAVSNGTAILGRVQLGAGIITTANGASDSSPLGAIQTVAGVGGIVAGVAKATPVVGQVLSGISVGLDLIGTGMNIAQCY